ncbi:hypothetical protein GCM10007094_35650 [Pseudovibrio japonicus]|uniref:Cadherin domain-containing protein n=1 Tax=Pseudovibrio japonicus TaxID=366534 RepID=A0ABQ3EJN6_9HYPH|nr:cadherin-like domain-containing protein [Pseudovibrio japonicus]GHB43110.1 hypothetical protein GCM10007094_35650 [Pseudovibrio japonicus]
MTTTRSVPAHASSQNALPPILLHEPPAPSKTPILFIRQEGQLVDLSKIVGQARLIRDGDELHILQSDGQIIVIEGFFGGPANEFFILMPSGPMATQGKFLDAVPVEIAPRLGSFQDPLPSPAQNETEDDARNAEAFTPPKPAQTNVHNAQREPALDNLNTRIQPKQLFESKQESDYSTLVPPALTPQPESIRFPELTPSDLYVKPNTIVTQAEDVPVPVIEEADLRTSTSISLSGTLAIDFGVDGTNSRALLFTLDAAGRPLGRSGDPLDITSGGARVLFQSEFGPQGQHVLKGFTQDGKLILKVTLDPTQLNGAYSYQQFAPLDHETDTSELLLSFRFVAKDADTDTLVSYLDLRIHDDLMPLEWNLSTTHSEAALPEGSEADSSGTTTTGTLPVSAGQGPVTLTWNDPSPMAGFNFVREGQTFVILQAGQVVLTVTLDSASGRYSATQHNPISHTSGGEAIFNLSFTATNSHGQQVDAKLIVTSMDDAPKAFPLDQIEFDESVFGTNAAQPSASGTLPHDTGADGAQITWQLPDPIEGLSYMVDGPLLSILQGGTLILTAQLTGSGGEYTVTQHNALKHQNGLDLQTLKLPYRITDGDGDTAAGHIEVAIKDDAPRAFPVDPIEFDESQLGTEPSLPSSSATLPHSAGADGAQITWQLPEPVEGLTYMIDGQQLSILQGGTLILTAQLTDNNGGYTIQQHNALQHQSGMDLHTLKLPYQITDGDGDTAAGHIEVAIKDDVPRALPIDPIEFDESHLGTEAGPPSSSGTLPYTTGADGGQVTWQLPEPVEGLTYMVEGQLLSVLQGGSLILTAQLTGSTGAYTVTQHNALQHESGVDLQTLKLPYQITDGDGDSAEGQIEVAIKDDVPRALPHDPIEFDESHLGTDAGHPSCSGNIPHTTGADGGHISWQLPDPVEGLTYMVDGPRLSILQSGTLILTAQFTDNSGAYTVTQHNALQHKNGIDLQTLKLPYRITDGDGDTAAGHIEVAIKDGVPRAFPLDPIEFDESQLGIDAGQPSSSGNIAHTTGADGAHITWQLPDPVDGLTYMVEGALLSILQGRTLILTAQLTGNSGTYTVTQHNPLQHQNGMDLQTIKLPYRITDGDGDTANGNINVSIKDDVPVIKREIDLALDDEILAPNGSDPEQAEDSQSLTGVLPVSTGVDEGSISWAQSPLPSGFSWSLDGATLTLFQGTTAIFGATLNSSSGAYSITQHSALNHAGGHDQFQLHYRVTDTDGDSAKGQLQVTIADTVPVLGSAPEAITLSENDLFAARLNGEPSYAQSGALNIQWGADTGVGTSLTFASNMSGLPAPFSVNGARVFYSLDGTGNQLAAKTQDGTLVFTVTLDRSGNGQYHVEFFTPIDHGAGREAPLSFSALASDGDGDTIPFNFSFTLGDGRSVATPDQFSGTEDKPLVLDLLANDMIDSGGFTIHLVLVPAKGTLTQNPDGSFNYLGHQHANGTDSFSYYIKDADGERSETVTVSIELAPDNDIPIFTGVTQGTPTHLTVEDTGPSEVFQASAADADGDSLRFFLQGPDKARFNIDEQTGDVSWKDVISFNTPTDANGDNFYEITVVVQDPAGAEAEHHYRIEVTAGEVPPPTLYLHTREAGSYQVSWDFTDATYAVRPTDIIQSNAWAEVGDDGLAWARDDTSSDIFIDTASGELVLSNRAENSDGGDDEPVSISKTFDLSGAQSAEVTLTLSAEFAQVDPGKLFYIEVEIPDGSIHRISEITSMEDLTQSKSISLDLSPYISPATTLRVVAPAELTGSDVLRIADLLMAIEQSEVLQQQNFESSYQLGGETLAVAKSAEIDGAQSEVTGMTLTLSNAKDGDELVFDPASGVTNSLDEDGNGVLTLTFSGAASAETYQALLNSVGFSSTSESLEDRNLTVILHTVDGDSSPSTTTIHVTPILTDDQSPRKNPVNGTPGDDILKSTEDNDVINGFEGDDELTAGAGADELTGGEGNDIFFFEQLDGAADHITDFQLKTPGGGEHDILNLSKLLDDYCVDDWGQYLHFSAQYIRVLQSEEGHYLVQVDLDGVNDNDYDWETVTTMEVQNTEAVGATISIDVRTIMPEIEIPITSAFPVT